MEWNPQDYYDNSQMQFAIGRIAIKKLNPMENESILDIGCGIGNLTLKIAEKSFNGKVVGIDIDRNMISYANSTLKEKNIHNTTFLELDGTKIPFQNEFDAIFSNMVLHWVRKLKKLFEKAYTSLKVGGRILISTIFDDKEFSQSLNPKIQLPEIDNQFLQNFIIKQHYKDILSLEEFLAYQSHVDSNLTYLIHNIKEFEEMIRKVGFTQIQIEKQIYWNEFNDIDKYFAYRRTLSWLFFLRYFPEKYRPQIVAKLRSLILTEWNKIPLNSKEFPIKEKWPVLFIQAKK